MITYGGVSEGNLYGLSQGGRQDIAAPEQAAGGGRAQPVAPGPAGPPEAPDAQSAASKVLLLPPEGAERLALDVAQRSTVAQRIEFVERLSQDAPSNPAAARAIGKVMASLTGEGVDRALRALDRNGVDAVVRESVLITGTGIAPGWFGKADLNRFMALANAVSSGNNPLGKAAFVAACGPLIEWLHQTGIQAPEIARGSMLVATAMSSVLMSDVTGVVEHVLMQEGFGSSDSSGRAALATHVSTLLRYGDADSGGVGAPGLIIESLRRGNNLNGDPKVYLAGTEQRSGDQEPYHHRAALLGAYLGVVGGAIDDRAGQRDRDAAVNALLFSFGIDVVMETLAVLFPAAKYPIALAKSGVKRGTTRTVQHVRNERAGGDGDWWQRLLDAALFLEDGQRLDGRVEEVILAYSGLGVRER